MLLLSIYAMLRFRAPLSSEVTLPFLRHTLMMLLRFMPAPWRCCRHDIEFCRFTRAPLLPCFDTPHFLRRCIFLRYAFVDAAAYAYAEARRCCCCHAAAAYAAILMPLFYCYYVTLPWLLLHTRYSMLMLRLLYARCYAAFVTLCCCC